MADEPRGFNPGWVDPREPGHDPVKTGDQAPTPSTGVPPESLPPQIKGGVGVRVLFDGYAFVIEIDTSDLYATPKPRSVTWGTLDPAVEAMIRDFSWGSLTGVPPTFPASPHTHTVAQITDFPATWAWGSLTGVPLTFPPSPHTHTVAGITDFPTTWAWTALTGVPASFPPSAHTHPWSEVTGKPAFGSLATRNSVNNSFIDGDSVDNGQLYNMAAGTIKGRAAGAGLGDPTDLTGTQVKAILSYTIADIPNLQTTLNGKVSEAPADGVTYGRKNGAWVPAAGAAQIQDTAPATGDPGTFWWSSLTGQLAIRYNDGSDVQWVGLNGSLTSAVMISDDAPASAYHGLLWWQSSTGELLIRYNDGTSEQWVSAIGGARPGDFYSTAETDTGKTWIDGKKIYRKVVNVGVLPNASGQKAVAHGIAGLGTFITVSGMAVTPGFWLPLPYPHATVPSAVMGLYADTTTVVVTTASDRSGYSAVVILEYTKA